MFNGFCKFLAALNFFSAGLMLACLLFSFLEEGDLFAGIRETGLMILNLFWGVLYLSNISEK